jgi:hypothetical protein
VDDAPRESEPFADVVTVASNVLLADLDIQGEEALHTSGLSENVSSVSQLRRLDYDSFVEIENIFITEEIDPPSAARKLVVEVRVIVWAPTDLSDIKVARNTQFRAYSL